MAENSKLNEMVSRRAYGIFFDELQGHCSRLDPIFEGKTAVLPEVVQKAAISFHTVKGGAGFFGLSELADLAAELETMFKDPVADIAELMNTAHPLYKRFKVEIDKLPEPQVG